jgi:catechol 2,3-dioxygenase-like lactoylglutathione lyase family enzyme
VLATKAPQLVDSKRGSLSAWLFHVTQFTCARLRRTQVRQMQLESSAYADRIKSESGQGTADGAVLLFLEDSIAELSGLEREIIIRRFYRHQRFAEIGSALGISTDATRKRSSRALEELRRIMLRDGSDVIPDTFLLNLNRLAGPRGVNKQLTNSRKMISGVKEQVAMMMIEQSKLSQGGYQLISVELLVSDVEANLQFFEKLGFPRRFVDKPDAAGDIPRASVTAGHLGKIWIRRAPASEIHPSSSINIFFWIDGGPDGLIAHRRKVADKGVPVTPIIDEQALPNFNVTTPDGYSVAFFTAYVGPGEPPVVLVL